MLSPNLSWHQLQDVYYTNRLIYDTLNWSITNIYFNYKIKISTNGTLIALASKSIKYPNLIEVYSISGNKIWSMIYNSRPDDHIVDFDFRNEDLVVVLSGSRLRYYYDFKGNFNEYNFLTDLTSLQNSEEIESSDATPEKVITNLENNQTEEIIQVEQINIMDHFLVIQLPSKFIIINLNTFTNFELTTQIDLTQIHAFELHYKSDTGTLTILATYGVTVLSFKVDFAYSNFSFIDFYLTDGPFTKLSISPDGQLVSLFNDTSSKIYIINAKFDRILLEYSTASMVHKPYQIEWCSNDAIVLSLKDEIKLIGPSQQSISFFYDLVDEELGFSDSLDSNYEISFTIPILKGQKDGLLVIGTKNASFINKVPDAARFLFEIGSSHPSGILLDCIDKLSTNSSKADKSISLLKSDNSLELAMNSCLDFALYEFNHYWQKKSLKAVSFGKTYFENYDPKKYLRTINYIKVLNQIRTPEIGLFLTYDQLISMGWEVFLSMLLKRDLYLLAIKVLELLGIEQYRNLIYVTWCCYKIKKELNLSDIELFKIVSNKLLKLNNSNANQKDQKDELKEQNYASMDQIFDTAYEEGRINLCKLLINLEPSINKKINQFIKFNEYELALYKTFQFGNDDLSKLILLYLQDTLPISKLFKLLNQNESQLLDTSVIELKKLGLNYWSSTSEILPINGDLISQFWILSIGKYSSKLLETFYKQEDKIHELNISRLTSYLNKDKAKSETYYSDYKSRLLKSINSATNSRFKKLFEKELELLEVQKKLGDTFMKNFYKEKSLNDILIKLIKLNQFKSCSTIVKDFKLNAENYWYLVLTTFVSAREFDSLYRFVKASKGVNSGDVIHSPIGFKVFVEKCLKYNAPVEQTSFYIRNCTNLRYTERIEFYLKIDDVALAATEAFKFKDLGVLKELLDGSDEELKKQIRGYISQLG